MADTNTFMTKADVVQDEPVWKRLNTLESCWTWKGAIRVIVSIVDLVAIGCCAYILAHPSILDANHFLLYNSYFNDAALGSIIVLGISLIWCLNWIIVPFLRRPARPLHPGIAVGFDLLLWLGLIVVALFTLSSILTLLQFGSYGSLDDPSSNYGNNYTGSYYLAPNKTWIYNITDTRPNYDTEHYNYTTERYEYYDFNVSDIVRSCTPEFATCEEQDAYINYLWHDRSKRLALNLVVEVVEWLGVLCHFAVFVWACVDTRRYNQNKDVKKGKMVANRIIADLEKRGLITVQDGTSQQGLSPAGVTTSHQPGTVNG